MTGREYGLVLATLKKGRTVKSDAYKGPQYWVSISRNGKDDVCGDTPELALIAAADAMGLSPVPVWTEEEIQQAVEVLRSRLRDGYDPFTAGYREAFKDLADELHAKKGDATDA